jgi:hypothetical protein
MGLSFDLCGCWGATCMRFSILLSCILVLTGCGGSHTAQNSGPAPETATPKISGPATEAVVYNDRGQIQMASGDLFGAPLPTTEIGVSKPYILKLPICSSSNMRCAPNVVPQSIVLDLNGIVIPHESTSTAAGK